METQRVQREFRREVVDETTGEVNLTEHITQSIVPREPDFIKLYLRDVMYLQDLPTSLNAILYQLLTWVDYEGSIIVNMARKKIISEQTKLSISTINNALSKFVKGKLLDRLDKGIYRANPYLFGKGDWKNIHRIRMQVTYSLAGKTIKAVIISDDAEEVQSDS
jgi:hypothetical protein